MYTSSKLFTEMVAEYSTHKVSIRFGLAQVVQCTSYTVKVTTTVIL